MRYAPLLVTALFARTDADAARLIEASVLSDAARAGGGEFLLMEAADPARGVLDADLDFVLPGLIERGYAARRVPFDPDLSGLTLAGFVTGSASLGRVGPNLRRTGADGRKALQPAEVPPAHWPN